MPDFYFSFMTPDVWDALVLATVFIGLAFAILRLMKDRAAYAYRQRSQAQSAQRGAEHSSTPEPDTASRSHSSD